MNYELINGDCLEELPKLVDKSVDLVLVDLPYGQTACDWDTEINLDDMWKQLRRIGKDNCQYIFFCTTKFGNKLINSNPKWFRYDLVWMKSNSVGFLSANKMPLRLHEMIYVFGKPSGGKKTYNPQKTQGKPYKVKGNKTKDAYGQKEIPDHENKTGDRHPTSILKFNQQTGLHRTQKPVDLCEWLIKTYSNENDLVLDFCMGSGTTGLACKNTNRRFIGIEKDKDIFEIAKNRI